MPARAEYIVLCRSLAATIGEMCRLDRDAIRDLKLAVTEACGNAVRHAYPGGGRQAEMEIECDVGGEQLVVVVRDWGRGVDRAESAGDSHGAGYGLRLIEALSEGVSIESGPEGVGTRVRFTRRLDGGREP